MAAPAVFAFGLVAFGFLGMGPVTIAVDSYGPVTDNAQSVYELSHIENVPGIKAEIKKDFGFEPDFEKGKEFLEENDGAGNTFKATAKPVLIGTAVVGATTMIFSHHHASLRERRRAGRSASPAAFKPWPGGATSPSSSPCSSSASSWAARSSTGSPAPPARRSSPAPTAPWCSSRRTSSSTGREGLGGGLEEGRPHLHRLRAEGHVEHLHRGLLRRPGLRLPRTPTSSSAT